MKQLKKIIIYSFVCVFSMSLLGSISASASEGNVTSDVIISFTEKSLKDGGKKIEPAKPNPKNPVISTNSGNGKEYYSALPKTGENSSSLITYVGWVLVLSALSYKLYIKRREFK